jgi:hypothetical protein
MRSEVLTMNLHRDTYLEYRRIIDANDLLPESYFWEFVYDLYGSSQSSAVRRLVDPHSDGVSLRRLMTEVEESCRLVTLEYFLGMYPSEDGQLIAQAERWWRRSFAGGAGDHVDPEIVSADLNDLITATTEVAQYVDRHLAHSDARPVRPDLLPTLSDAHESIDVISRLFQRYHLLITGDAVAVHPQVLGDWRAVFRQAWTADADDE